MLKSFRKILNGDSEDNDVRMFTEHEIITAFDNYFTQTSIPKPLGGMVLLEPIERLGAVGNIILPDNYESKDQYGIVLAIGEKVNHIKVGDKVLYFKGSGEFIDLSIDDDFKQFLVMYKDDIKAII
jgi:chaperonin GroES